jgi:hypothetical protein
MRLVQARCAVRAPFQEIDSSVTSDGDLVTTLAGIVANRNGGDGGL